MDIDERKRIFLATAEKKVKQPGPSLCLDNLLRNLGLNVGRRLDQISHHLVALLLASSLDAFQFLLGLLVRIRFGRLESARVLR